MSFWSSAVQVAAKMDRFQAAENKLLTLAREFGDRNGYEYKISTFDTPFPRSVLPLADNPNEDDEMLIHGIRVQSTTAATGSNVNDNQPDTGTPLVLLHGYMNAGAYFYRNLVGLTHYFETVYSLDLLGWGMSSRPDFSKLITGTGTNTNVEDMTNTSNTSTDGDEITAAENFFVESLEAWRKHNNIPKMILAGHSMGGYMSVAYCEKYPQHVERLILLSPVGVPEEDQATRDRRQAMKDSSWKVWAMLGVAQNIFLNHSAGGVLRSMPTKWGENMFLNYVQKRLPAISDPEEQQAVSAYLVANNVLPGSGEHAINKVLNPFAYAKRPTEYRIPKLKVPSVTFLYGDHDWMDPAGGLKCQEHCEQQAPGTAPDIKIYSISNAGHLLMLENWKEFNAGVVLGAGGTKEHLPPKTIFPRELHHSSHSKMTRQTSRSSTASSSEENLDRSDPIEQ